MALSDFSADIASFEKDLQSIIGEKKLEDLEDVHFDQIIDKINDYVDDVKEKHNIPIGGAADEASMQEMMVGRSIGSFSEPDLDMGVGRSIGSFSDPELELSTAQVTKAVEKIKNTKSELVWWALKRLLGDAIKATEDQWKNSTPVHLKVDDLESVLAKYNMGMGATMLYHDMKFGDDDYIVSYVISGITESRFSHATMVFPVPEFPNTPALWQSGSGEPIKLGGGTCRRGPDMADLKELVRYYIKGWPSSRFVFRPLLNPLSQEEQQKALQFKNEIMADKDMTFPSDIDMGWMWIISKYPKLALFAEMLGHDCGVVDDKYTSMFCSMLVTDTLLSTGRLTKPIKAGQFSPGDYGLPANAVGQTPGHPIYGQEYEFIFDDVHP